MTTKEMRQQGIRYCSRCKTTSGPFIRSNKTSYACNPCNSERRRKYYWSGGKERIMEANKTYTTKNPERLKSWQIAQQLPKNPCQVSGCEAEKTHKHHPDPLRPLSVVYLCPLHHRHVHLGKIESPAILESVAAYLGSAA